MRRTQSVFIALTLLLAGPAVAAEPGRWNVMHWRGCYQVAIEDTHGGACYNSPEDAWRVADRRNEKERRMREAEIKEKWEKTPRPLAEVVASHE